MKIKIGDTIRINKALNIFFDKNDLVKIVADWGDMLYVEKVKGIHRIAIDKFKDVRPV